MLFVSGFYCRPTSTRGRCLLQAPPLPSACFCGSWVGIPTSSSDDGHNITGILVVVKYARRVRRPVPLTSSSFAGSLTTTDRRTLPKYGRSPSRRLRPHPCGFRGLTAVQCDELQLAVTSTHYPHHPPPPFHPPLLFLSPTLRLHHLRSSTTVGCSTWRDRRLYP